MGRIPIGLNAEFSRSSDKPFEWAVEKAAEMGYTYFEPMVHFGRELMSEAGYFHSVSMFDDPFRIKDACDKAGAEDLRPRRRTRRWAGRTCTASTQAGHPRRRRDRRAGRQHRRRDQGEVDHRGGGLHVLIKLHAAGGGVHRRARAA